MSALRVGRCICMDQHGVQTYGLSTPGGKFLFPSAGYPDLPRGSALPAEIPPERRVERPVHRREIGVELGPHGLVHRLAVRADVRWPEVAPARRPVEPEEVAKPPHEPGRIL